MGFTSGFLSATDVMYQRQLAMQQGLTQRGIGQSLSNFDGSSQCIERPTSRLPVSDSDTGLQMLQKETDRWLEGVLNT